MKSKIRLFLAFLCLLGGIAAHAQEPIRTCGTLITHPGRYELANDLLNCTGSGVRVQTNGIVIINLNSHQITGTARRREAVVEQSVLRRGVPVCRSTRKDDLL
jgi:hypothetical protein